MSSQSTAWLGVFAICLIDAIYYGILEAYTASCGHAFAAILAAYYMFDTAESPNADKETD